MEAVRRWLESLGLGQYAAAFADNAITWDLLPGLTDTDLKEIGVAALGHRKRILQLAATLDGEAQPVAPISAPVGSHFGDTAPAARGAERRQLTVMFCDLVGSTALSQRLDPEDLRDLIGAFQGTCRIAIEAHQGYVARYMGDGLLAYFGYPNVAEDDAERSLRAGLSLLERLAHPILGVSLSARVGIATGPVVVGDVIGEGAAQESAVVGMTPNLAARLQALAEPDQILVSETTHSLTRGFFVYDSLGDRELRGIDGVQKVWRAVRARPPGSRFEALHDGAISALVGRDSELDLLMNRWRTASAGEGQLVLLGGEAGVGKSRLSEAVIARAQAEATQVLRYQCAPNQVNTAYYPFIAPLQRSIGIEVDDTPERKFAKIGAFARTAVATSPDAPTVLAGLLSVSVQGVEHDPVEPGRRKAQTIEVLEAVIASYGGSGPLFILFEDIHWLDPSSQEVLDSLVSVVAGLPALMVLTLRPEFNSPWRGHGHLTELRLNHLRQSDSQSIIDTLCGTRSLPIEVSQAILSKTDGVPLFVEELTRAVLASDLLVVQDDAYVLAGAPADMAIPSTLSDSLMARLDRLSEARPIAQTAACIGREFSHTLLAAVTDLPPDRIDAALRELEAEHLLYRRGTPPQARYMFKHALIADAAAASLLNRDRRRIHQRIAEALEATEDVADEQPELLAHHYSEAGATENAVAYWLRAGEKAARQEAHRETIAHLNRGITLLTTLPPGPQRDVKELDFQVALGAASMHAMGYGARAGEQAYERARVLFERLALDDPYRRFAVLSGLRRSYLHHGQLDAAAAIAQECLAIARRTQADSHLRDAYASVGTVLAMRGDFAAAVNAFEEGARYDVVGPASLGSADAQGAAHDRHRARMSLTASNHSYGAVVLWCSGYPDRACRWRDEVLRFVATIEQPYSKAYYLYMTAILSVRMRDYDGLMVQTQEAHRIAAQNQLALLSGWTQACSGWGQVMLGRTDDLAPIRQGIAIVADSGSLTNAPFLATLLAEACLTIGDSAQGLLAIDEAERIAAQSGILEYAAETSRIKASLQLLACPDAREAPEASLREAVALAGKQQAKSFELRSAVALARFLSEGGERAEARAILAAAYEWFTEGFETPGLMEARALLAELD